MEQSLDKSALMTLELTIPEAMDRQRLDKALTSLLVDHETSLSRARLQSLMAAQQITLNNAVVTDASSKVKTGQIYTITIPPLRSAVPEAQSIELDIVYEDNDLIVINKPAGMVVHPAPGNHDHTLVNALLAHCGKSLSGIGGVARPGIVHRLDKDTSGLMVVAKNDITHQELTKQFANHSLSRVYHALVWGIPLPTSGDIETSIGRHPRERIKMAVTSAQKGKSALTHYRVLKEFDLVSLVECKLATGRTHQIRVHMAHIKHPVVGDKVYGNHRNPGAHDTAQILRAFPRQALHALHLQFCHPRTKKNMRFKVALPLDMQKLLRKL